MRRRHEDVLGVRLSGSRLGIFFVKRISCVYRYDRASEDATEIKHAEKLK